MSTRHAVLLLLYDERGHCGLGESWVNFPPWAPWERRAAFREVLIPALTDRQVDDIPLFVTQVYTNMLGMAEQSGTVGPLLQAICAVELALWDLRAQQESVPLARLLFQKPRDRVRVYASGINPPISWPLIDQYLDLGIRLFKIKLGFGDDQDRRTLSSLRKHLGDRADIAVDVNRAWRLEQALAWLDYLSDCRVSWLEEPLRADEAHQLRLLNDKRTIPIAAGENILMPPGCNVESIAATPVSILQPDLTKYAPLHVAVRLLEASRDEHKRVVPHFLGSAPGQAATLHFAAGCDDALVEWDINPNPLRTDLLEPTFRITDGAIEIPERPGLGWQLRA